jgi:Partial alpha/beta-hydrolase lipase region
MIENAGYKSESYTVATEDGYILRVHRIKVQKPSNLPRRGPVFFMHGLFATATDYLLTGADIALRKSLENIFEIHIKVFDPYSSLSSI